MVDWVTISALATAGGTLVLAVATFSSVRWANRAARAAERSLLAGLRPVLMPSRLHDPPEKISFVDDHYVRVEAGHAVLEVASDAIYMAIALRNAGHGLAVLHGWTFHPDRRDLLEGLPDPRTLAAVAPGDPSQFRRLSRDIYVPGGDLGF